MLQRQSVVHTVVKRGLAVTQPQITTANLPDADVKTSRTPSGVLVTSVERAGALSRLGIAFRAGSRYETQATRGAAHRLRNSVGLASQGHSAYELMWRAGVLGAQVDVGLTRDLFFVTLDAYRDYSVPAMEVLGELCVRPAFRAWELADSDEQLAIERAQLKLDYAARTVELLHAAAYRNGALGHSLIAPKWAIGKHKEGQMLDFANAHLLSGEACVVGVNVDHEHLYAYAQSAPIREGKAAPLPASPYQGGEQRKHTNADVVHAMVAGECAGLADAKGSATAAVLSALLSGGPSVKYANTCGAGVASKAAAAAAGASPYGVTGVHELHADTGLVGVYCIAEAATIGKVTQAAVKALRDVASAGPSADDLQRAKNVTLARALQRAESDDGVREDAMTQAMSGSDFATTPTALAELIQAVGQQDVQSAAKKAASKLSMASVGNLSAMPYLDEM